MRNQWHDALTLARLLVAEWRGERDQQGQGLVEYGLIVVLIAIACLGAMSQVGGALITVFTKAATNL